MYVAFMKHLVSKKMIIGSQNFNHFLVFLVVIFSIIVYSVGGTDPKYKQVKYCKIPFNQRFTCGKSEYRCQYRCTVNSKCNLYSVRRIHSSCYRYVFHICTNETFGCQGHWETNCSDWKTYMKAEKSKEKNICGALRDLVTFIQFKNREAFKASINIISVDCTLLKFRGGLSLRRYFISLERIWYFLAEIQLDNIFHLSVLSTWVH